MRVVFLVCFVLLGFLNSNECWSNAEKDDNALARVDNFVVFSVIDAKTCKPIVYAEVKIGELTRHTDENGELKIPIVVMQGLKKFNISIKKDGYATIFDELSFETDAIENNKFFLHLLNK